MTNFFVCIVFVLFTPPALILKFSQFWQLSQFRQVPITAQERPVHSSSEDARGVATLKFSEFFEMSGSELRPSPRLMSLSGRRVSITGYMVATEKPLKGAFYLCPRRVYADESGGGTADFPVETVLVIVNSAKDRKIDYIANPIEVIGLLRSSSRGVRQLQEAEFG
jgi:hypothetical protein